MAPKAPKGTADLIGEQARSWERFVEVAREVFTVYGYERIETPAFEQTDLFVRGCGETTDVATKEMFSVYSVGAVQKLRDDEPLKDDQRLALRPEGTASIVRAAAEHGLVTPGGAPVKLWYAGPMFRCERPQKGRLREFRQVGVECLGATDAASDAEMIIMCMRFFSALGIPDSSMRLLINSMGDEGCRPAYTEKVAAFLHEHADALCDDCRRRADTNPLRAFDCKNEDCQAILADAPRFTDNLCPDCEKRFDEVKSYLTAAGLDFTVDPTLVRGFDYYTGTVFEVQVEGGLGAQSAIGGGGRYDNLMAEVGGPDTCGLGFAVGYERIMLALDAAGVTLADALAPTVYVACVDDTVRDTAFDVSCRLRDAGVRTLGDLQGRSLKSQFKVADKAQARLCVVVGPDEVAAGRLTVRDMCTHEEGELTIDGIVDGVKQMLA